MDRIIHLSGVQNARDLGGLPTESGVIRPRLLLRSAHLSRATKEDHQILLHEYDLKTVLDLRTSEEISEQPDTLPSSVEWKQMKVLDDLLAGITHEEESRRFMETGEFPPMEKLYQAIITTPSAIDATAKTIHTILTNDFSSGSILWHCTEGKDRCGLISAIVLSILGVKEELILEDYLMTNIVNAPKAEQVYTKLLSDGKSEKTALSVKNAYLAKESYFFSAMDAIQANYGSMDAFIAEALSVSQNEIICFKEQVIIQ